MSTNLVVLFTFLVLFTAGFFTLMSTFYYSTNDFYKFSSTIYFSSAFYWILHVD